MENIKRNMTLQHHMLLKAKFQKCFDQEKTHWNMLNAEETILKKLTFHLLFISCFDKETFSLDTF